MPLRDSIPVDLLALAIPSHPIEVPTSPSVDAFLRWLSVPCACSAEGLLRTGGRSLSPHSCDPTLPHFCSTSRPRTTCRVRKDPSSLPPRRSARAEEEGSTQENETRSKNNRSRNNENHHSLSLPPPLSSLSAADATPHTPRVDAPQDCWSPLGASR